MIAIGWFVIGIFALAAKSGYQIWQKVLVNDYDALSISQSALMSSTIVLLIAVAIIRPTVYFGSVLILPVLSGFVTALGLWSFTASMEKSDLSIVSPIQQTIPVFASLIEPIAVGTFVYESSVVVASLVTAIGAYIVVIEPNKPFLPIKKLIGGGGPLLALATALFFGLSAVFISVGTQTIDLSYYLMFHTLTGFICLSVINQSTPEVSSEVLGYGIVYAINLILSVYVISAISASRATIFFRISLVINVVVGFAIFSDRHIMYRILGSLIIVSGVVISVL